MIMIKPAFNPVILVMIIALKFNIFYAIKYALEYMLMPDLVPLIWFLLALTTQYFATILMAPLLL